MFRGLDGTLALGLRQARMEKKIGSRMGRGNSFTFEKIWMLQKEPLVGGLPRPSVNHRANHDREYMMPEPVPHHDLHRMFSYGT